MKRELRYIFTLLAAAMMIGCSESAALDAEVGEGVMWQVSLRSASGENLASTSTRSGDETDYSKALENSVMKIYDAENRLVRRYEPLAEAPATIYLIAGDYRVTVRAGESLSPVDSKEDLTFEGESNFTISAASTSSVAVNCKMINNAVTVKFTTSMVDNMEEGYSVLVAPAAAIDDVILSESYFHKKIFTESGVVYFIQPDGETNLAWRFEGVRKFSDEVISRTGVIADVVSGESNCLTFSYDKELIVSNALVSVDTSTDDRNDIFEFSPQPTVNGADFDISAIQIADGRNFDIKLDAIYELNNVTITYGASKISPFVNGEVQQVEGASYVVTKSTGGVLTIDNSYFTNIGAGGDQTLLLVVSDVKGSKTEKEFVVTTSGVTAISAHDFWANTATIGVCTVDPAITEANTTVEYRTKGSSEWISCAVAAGSTANSLTAKAISRWSAAKQNAKGLNYFTLEDGIQPNKEYECRLVVDGVARATTIITTPNTTQSIPEGNLNNSLPCWGSDSEGSSTWGSGNNTFTSKLCTQGSRGDASKCAYMAATEAVGKFAAGNLFYGQFQFNGVLEQTGTVRFGQPFAWSVRPKSLKLRYSAVVGQGNMTVNGVSYSHDRARIYFAIVDWSKRREVTAGSGSPEGVWDPETMTKVDEGQIIGYASYYIDESTDGSMHDLELPIYYYDTVTKPSKSISLVISCATSAYGDYMTGSKESKLWVDDFAFGY